MKEPLILVLAYALAECEFDHAPDEEEEAYLTRNTVVLIITALVGVTIVFEFCKDKVEEAAVGSLEPIIAALWSELTVLGFVGVVTFILDRTHLLNKLSCTVFDEEEEMPEALESIHMLLFLIMVLFIVEALMMVYIAKHISKMWKKMEGEVMDQVTMDMKYKSSVEDAGAFDSLSGLQPKNEHEWVLECVEYKALRDNFVRPATIDGEERRSLPPNFDFAEYLTLCAGRELGEIVEVGRKTWVFFLILCTLFWVVFRFNFWVRLGCFIFSAYVQLAVVWVARRKLLYIRHHLLPVLPHHTAKEKSTASRTKSPTLSPRSVNVNASVETEDSPLLLESGITHMESAGQLIPKYFKTAQSKPRHKIIGHLMGSMLPNKHESLFWMGAPKTTFYLVQSILLVNAVYISLCGYYFLWELIASDAAVYIKLILIVLAVLPPPIVTLKFVPFLVWRHIEVSNVEMLRKRDAELAVQRLMKTKRSIRAIKMIAMLNYKAAETQGNTSINTTIDLDPDEREELRKLFDLFDADGGGSIDTTELEAMFQQLHQQVTKEELDIMVNNVDKDGSGDLDFEEFCNLMASRVRSGNVDFEESAKVIFATFDEDGSGSITYNEFRDTLRTLDPSFSLADIDAIIEEMDRDGDGKIDAEEFTELLKRHMDD